MASDDPKQHDAQSISDEIDLAVGAFFLGSEEHVHSSPAPASNSEQPAAGAASLAQPTSRVLDPEAAGTADFLGLDADLRAQWGAGAALDPEATNSWLWSVEQEEHAARAQGEEHDDPLQAGEFVETQINPDGIGEEITLAPDAPLAPRRSRRLVLVAASIALVLGLATITWIEKHTRAPANTESIVALAPRVKPPPKTAPKTEVPKAEPAPTPTEIAQAPTPTTAVTPDPEPTSPPIEASASEPVATSEPLVPEPAVAQTSPSIRSPQPGLTFIPNDASAPRAPPTTLPSGLRHPSAYDLKGIWGETTIPFDAVLVREWMHTPHVGAVRVRLKAGGAFEGRLDCVGFAQVWIDIGIGLLGFDDEYVASVELIDVAIKDLGKEPDFQTRIAGLPYVEVRVAGGWLAGWQLSRAGHSVTLITPEPGKVTLDSDEVRPASTGRAILRGPLQKN